MTTQEPDVDPKGLEPPAEGAQTLGPRTAKMTRSVAMLVDNTVNGRWLSVSDLRDTLYVHFAFVSDALAEEGPARFSLRSGALLVNGVPVTTTAPEIATFIRHLSDLNVENFSLEPDVSLDEFGNFLDLLCKQPGEMEEAGGFTAAVNDAGFEHIHSRKVILREVADDEMVVAKRADEARAAEREDAEATVLGMLKADTTTPDEHTADSVHAVATDKVRMADIIMEAAHERGGEDPATAEAPMADRVVTCVERAFDSLVKHKSSKTQKGRKAIAKALKELEGELTTRLAKEDGSDGGEKTVVDAVGRMTEGLKMEAIADDYAKKIRALEQSEKRILKFMKAQGLERVRNMGLEDQLTGDGLDVSGWHALLAKSSATREEADAAATVDATGNAIMQLAKLLDQIGDATAPSAGGSEKGQQLAAGVVEAGKQVRAVAASTQRKIDDLVEDISADLEIVDRLEKKARDEGRGPKLSRRKIVEILAEIVQELYQPLSVVICTLGMIGSSSKDSLPRAQFDLLKLAEESALRIQTLIASLEKVAGQPESATPDRAILDAAYGKSS